MRKEPLISVIIPSYNYEAYIGQAAESAAAQSYPELELVIVDDCSKDASLAASFPLSRNRSVSRNVFPAGSSCAGTSGIWVHTRR